MHSCHSVTQILWEVFPSSPPGIDCRYSTPQCTRLSKISKRCYNMGPHFASQHSSSSALISSISPSGSLLTSETPQLKNGWTLSNHTWRAAEDKGNTSLRCIKGEKRRTDQEIRFATSSRQSGNGVGLHQRRAAAARQFSSVLICGASMWTSNWEPHFGSVQGRDVSESARVYSSSICRWLSFDGPLHH